MRAIGQAEMALEMLCQRSVRREAFGQPLAKLGANFDIIAECRMEIEMARLLCLKAAWMIDQGDARAAAPWISQIKVIAPRVALRITDEAVQMFGAHRHQPGYAAGALVDASEDIAPRRRARCRASPPGGADGAEEIHAGESLSCSSARIRSFHRNQGVSPMTIPSEMKALLLVGDGYTKTPSGSVLEAMEPYLEPGSIAVPAPGPSQVLIKVSLASINPSDVAFIKGQYGQPRVKGRPAGFEGVGTVVAGGDDPYPKSLVGKRGLRHGPQQLGLVGGICRRRGGRRAFRFSTRFVTKMVLR